jgi:fructose-1,6-bisphosphatase/inositol monophosphatase family enzyme
MTPKVSDLEFMARQAGDILRSGYGRQHKIDQKGIIDLVTEVDHQSEDFLVGEIRRRFRSRILTRGKRHLAGDKCCIYISIP